MSPVETLRIRATEAEACIAALSGNTLACRVLTARMQAHRDAVELLDATEADARLAAMLEAPRQSAKPAGADDASPPASPAPEPFGPIPTQASPVEPVPMPTPLPQPTTEPSVAPSRAAPSATAASSGQSSPRAAWITPARLDLIRRLWGDRSVTTREIMDRVNALPGTQITNPNSITAAAATHCKLPMSRVTYAEQLGAAAPPTSQRAPETTPPDTAPSTPPAGGIPASAEEIDEAREMMRSANVGAKALAEYFGWTLSQAQDIAARIRAAANERAA